VVEIIFRFTCTSEIELNNYLNIRPALGSDSDELNFSFRGENLNSFLGHHISKLKGNQFDDDAVIQNIEVEYTQSLGDDDDELQGDQAKNFTI
jgi:hypothetical protein